MPSPRTVKIRATTAQREVIERYLFDTWETQVIATGGSRFGGKTFMGAHCIGYRRLMHRGTKALCLRTVQRAADLNMGEELKQSFFAPHGFPVGNRKSAGEVQYLEKDKRFVFPNGSMIQLGYCLRPNDWEQHLGIQWDDIWFEQAEQFPERVFNRLGGSNRPSNPECVPRMLLTFNPGGIGSEWIYRRIINETTRDRRVVWVKSVVRECAATLERDPGYILRSLATITDPVLRAQWLDGDWDALSGIFFRLEPDTEKRLGTLQNLMPPDYAEWYCGVDWGSKDPFACVWVVVWRDEKGLRHIHVAGEIYQRGLHLDQQAKVCLEKDDTLRREYPHMREIVKRLADPSTSNVMERESEEQSRSKASVWRNHGFITYPSFRYGRTSRWEFLRYLIHNRIMTISPDCVNLIREFKSAVSMQEKEDIDQDRCPDHALDALAYITGYLFGLNFRQQETEVPEELKR